MKVFLLLTHGTNWDSFPLPDEIGKLRAHMVARELYADPQAKLAVAGGYLDSQGFTLADRMISYFTKTYPDLAERLIASYGGSNHTVRDVMGLAPELDRDYPDDLRGSITLVPISRSGHCLRIMPAINKLAYQGSWIDSGEPVTMGERIIDLALILISLIDPFYLGRFGRRVERKADAIAEDYKKKSATAQDVKNAST